MDPTGGIGLWALLGVIIAVVLLWIFAPFNWALGISIVLVVAFVAFIVWVFSNARFT
jgi:hypothetical protein